MCQPQPQLLGDQEIWISATNAAKLLGVSSKTIRRRAETGRYRTQTAKGRGGACITVALADLGELAVAEYHRVRTLPVGQHFLCSGSSACGDSNAHEADPTPTSTSDTGAPETDTQDYQALWQHYDRHASAKAKEEAQRRLEIMHTDADLQESNTKVSQIDRQLVEQYSVSPAKIYRLRQLVRGHPKSTWLPLLCPQWKAPPARAQIADADWDFIWGEWARTSRPSLAPIYHRAQERARNAGRSLASIDTVKRRIEDVPHPIRVLLREGKDALRRFYPAQERDYRTLRLHELWCSDGRKADVMVRWPDGTIGRPIVVAWEEVRSRVILGYEIGKTESAELVAISLGKASENCGRVICEAPVLDNGRGFASKLISGGVQHRFRFKVTAKEVTGILGAWGITHVHWTWPYSGQSKPIESFWNRIAEAERGDSRFDGAYLGNAPNDRPEEFDSSKAITIKLYRDVIDETIERYHRTPHRGSGMGGRAPMDVYSTLLQQTQVKTLTREQLRLSLLAAEAIELRKKDHSVFILGNRYYGPELATLPRDRTYTVRFNPHEARDPVSLYDRERFVCEVPLVEASGFRSTTKAKEQQRSRNEWLKAVGQQAAATKGMRQAKSWQSDDSTADSLPTTPASVVFPPPKVSNLVHLPFEKPKAGPGQTPGTAQDLADEIDRKYAEHLARKREAGRAGETR